MNIHKNKTALVTASSGGIGFEIAKKLYKYKKKAQLVSWALKLMFMVLLVTF